MAVIRLLGDFVCERLNKNITAKNTYNELLLELGIEDDVMDERIVGSKHYIIDKEKYFLAKIKYGF
jgi:hypothetical protein